MILTNKSLFSQRTIFRSVYPLAFALVAFFNPLRASGTVSLPSLFANYAVLQYGKPVPIWGMAEPGEEITVSYLDQTKKTTAVETGHWMVKLDAMKPGLKGELVVSGENTVRFSDVVTGAVWLFSGQSNMSFQLKATGDKEAIAAAANSDIRFFFIPLNNIDTPQYDLNGRWLVCAPQSAGDFSAVGYYFARDYQAAAGIPVGVISSSKGGSTIEAWMSREALTDSGMINTVLSRWNDMLSAYSKNQAEYEQTKVPAWEATVETARAAGKPLPPKPQPPRGGPGDYYRTPMGLYNGMIHPLMPYGLEGIAWYQGESNASKSEEYAGLCKAMISAWRKGFKQEDLPFLYVQLPNYIISGDRSDQMWAHMREVQAGLLSIPRTGMAVTIDVGDPHDVHSKNKKPVGERLSLLARAMVMKENVLYTGPQFQTAEKKSAVIQIQFDFADGLMTRDGASPGGLEVAGSDGTFHAAKAEIVDETLLVSSPEVAQPTMVRYAWENNPVNANLINRAGLPAAPFCWPQAVE